MKNRDSQAPYVTLETYLSGLFDVVLVTFWRQISICSAKYFYVVYVLLTTLIVTVTYRSYQYPREH